MQKAKERAEYYGKGLPIYEHMNPPTTTQGKDSVLQSREAPITY